MSKFQHFEFISMLVCGIAISVISIISENVSYATPGLLFFVLSKLAILGGKIDSKN